jgi:uncharacterized protein YcfJ
MREFFMHTALRHGFLVVVMALVAGLVPARAQTATPAPLSPKAQYEADSKQITARYKSDLGICKDEATADARMQCKRDASAQYDKAMADAKARMTAATQTASAAAACTDCGKVQSVTVSERKGEGSAVGLVAGGAAGALLGHEIGGGGKLGTIAGAAGGALVGREVERRVKTHKVWTVKVKFADPASASFEFDKDPGFKVGELVRRSDKTIVRP